MNKGNKTQLILINNGPVNSNNVLQFDSVSLLHQYGFNYQCVRLGHSLMCRKQLRISVNPFWGPYLGRPDALLEF